MNSSARSKPGDWSVVALFVIGSLVFGWGVNLLRSERLPVVYQDKASRLDRSLALVGPPSTEKATASSPPADLTLAAFQAVVKEGKQVVLDARPGIFYRVGHVPGAISLPRADFAAAYARLKARLEQARHDPMVVYCSDDSCEDSHLVQMALEKLDYTHVAVFPGGWSEWNGAGLSKEVSAP